MGLIDTLREQLTNIGNTSSSETVAQKQDGSPPMTARMDLLDMPEPPDPKTKDYLDSYRGWVYSCIKAISNEVAKIDLVLYRKKGNKIEIVEEDHEALEVLDRVNDYQTRFDFLEGVQSYLELSGEAFVYKFANGQKELWTLRPDWVKVLPPKKKGQFIGGYEYYVPGMRDPKKFEPDEIIHFKYFNPKNPYRGMGSLKAAAYAYDTDFFATKWNRQFFYNNAIPSAILTTDQSLKAKEVKRIKEQWRSKFSGVKKAHLFAVLTGGLKFDQGFKQSIKDMEFLNLRKFSRDEIFSIFQVPKTLVSITEDVNRANAQEHKAVFIENVIKPKMSRLVAFLNEFYVNDFENENETLYFGYKDPSPENVEMNLKLIESGMGQKTGVGWLSINEARDLMGYDDIGDDGDRIFAGFSQNEVGNTQKDPNYINVKTKKDKNDKGIVVRHKITPADVLKKKVKDKVIHSKEFRELVYHIISKKSAEAEDKEKEEKKHTHKEHKHSKGKKKIIKIDGEEYQRLPDDKAETFWKQMIARSEAQEIKLQEKVVKFFEGQRKRVLAQVNGIKRVKAIKVVDNYTFDLGEEAGVMVEIVDDIIQAIVAQAGQSALDFIGSSETFNFIDDVILAVTNFEELLSLSVNSTTKDKLTKTLAEGIANDESVDKLATRVNEVYDQAVGSRAEQIARTETIRANNLGHIAGYKQSGIVEYKEWLVTYDSRVCEWCLAMEQQYPVRALDEPFLTEGFELEGVEGGVYKVSYDDLQAPPLHTSCRCTVIPIVKVY